jgi:hypothetical protein
MRHIIVNITEDGRGQFWTEISDNTPEAVLAYVEGRKANDEGAHIGHAQAGGTFMVGQAWDDFICTSAIRPTTVKFYKVEPAVPVPVPRFKVTPV